MASDHFSRIQKWNLSIENLNKKIWIKKKKSIWEVKQKKQRSPVFDIRNTHMAGTKMCHNKTELYISKCHWIKPCRNPKTKLPYQLRKAFKQ